jgi:hypothetical protein
LMTLAHLMMSDLMMVASSAGELEQYRVRAE